MDEMKHNLLVFMYIKTGVAFLLATTLCIVTSIFIQEYSCLLFLPVIALWFAYSIWSIHKQQKDGNLVAIFAECQDIMPNKIMVLDKFSKKKSFRFVTISEAGEESTTFYIVEEYGKFRPGESYCLLFRRSDSNDYSEKNLLTSTTIHQTVGTTLTVTNTAEDDITPAESENQTEA